MLSRSTQQLIGFIYKYCILFRALPCTWDQDTLTLKSGHNVFQFRIAVLLSTLHSLFIAFRQNQSYFHYGNDIQNYLFQNIFLSASLLSAVCYWTTVINIQDTAAFVTGLLNTDRKLSGRY